VYQQLPYLKDDEKIFAGSAPRQLDQIRQIAPCRGGFILDAQRTQEVSELTEAGGGARKEEDVGIRSATVRAAAARTPAFQIVWSCKKGPVTHSWTELSGPTNQGLHYSKFLEFYQTVSFYD
jgi:hypothetical protein